MAQQFQKLNLICSLVLCSYCAPYLGAQTLLEYKDNAPLAMDLFWTQGFRYLENERYTEALVLLETLTVQDLSSCKSLLADFAYLKRTLLEEDQISAEKAFTNFVMRGILIDMYQLKDIESSKARSQKIQTLFKELISIQKYAKRFEFETYRDLVISFRRLNQLSKDKPQTDSYINNRQFVQEIFKEC